MHWHIHIGRCYLVRGIFPGDFVGRCLGVVRVGGEKSVQMQITDTLRPAPRIPDKCPFPECVQKQDHAGDHEFLRIRVGNYIDVPVRSARFFEVEKEAA